MGHTPERQCILCREKFTKNMLIRIVKNESGISIDETHKKDGRGAYICRECIKSDDLIKRRVLDRAFRMKVSDEVYGLLKGENNG